MSRESTGYQRPWPRSRMAKTRSKLETGNISNLCVVRWGFGENETV